VADAQNRPPGRALSGPGSSGGSAGRDEQRRETPPPRPSLANPNAAPVLTKVPPPASVRLSQLCWVLSFFAGGTAIVYCFIIRQKQLPLIADFARSVSEGRADATYTTAADIIFWSMFGVMVGVLLVQITLLVAFTNRRPNTRWWQLATFAAQTLLFVIGLELVAGGEDGVFLRQLLLAQCALALLGLLFSTMPGALRWTARGHDVRRGPGGDGAEL